MADAIYKQVLDAVVTAIKGLDLTGIEDAEIVLRKVPWDGDMLHKGITVSWDEDKVDWVGNPEGTNERDMVGYPCHVTIVGGTGRGWADEIGTVSKWREDIRRTFHCKRLAGMESVSTHQRVICKVGMGGPSIPAEYLKNSNVSQMTIWVWSLETRALQT